MSSFKKASAAIVFMALAALQGCGAGLNQSSLMNSLLISVAGANSSANQQTQTALQLSPKLGQKIQTILQASGGKAPYRWTVASGSLPSGVALSDSGVLSGTASEAGTWESTVKVQDSAARGGIQSMRVAIGDASATDVLTIATGSLPRAQIGTAYSTELTATGGSTPYLWFATSGSLPKGMSISTAGLLSGTPAQTGTFNFTVAAADSTVPAQGKTKILSLTVTAPPLIINTSSVSSGTVDVAYSATLAASGGTPAYRWSLASGTLPTGLTLTSGGVLIGTPTASGRFSFSVAVTDAASQLKTQAYTVVIEAPPLLVTTTSLPSGQIGSAYSAAFTAKGGKAPYLWFATSGSLPKGLSISTTGVLAGIPTQSGTFSFTVAVADSSSPSQGKVQTLSLTIAALPLGIGTSTLTSGTQNTTYSATLAATGGTPAYTWTLASGSLPGGVTLSPTGLLSGTPTASGTFTFAVTVSDAGSPTQRTTKVFSLIIAAVPLSISTTSLSNATLGAAYSATFAATGGKLAYTWFPLSGSLASGLSFSQTGTISGIPTQSGTFTFTVAVIDSSVPTQAKMQTLSLTVVSNSLAVNTSGVSSGQVSQAYTGALQASGGTAGYTWSLTSGTLPTGLSLSATTGMISGTPATAGTFTFTVKLSDNSSPAQTATATVAINIASNTNLASAGTTWFVRSDGGTRYSANVPTGQCDGKGDAAYPGSGINQHCAFKDFRYLWDDKSGSVGLGKWVIAGGDTVLVRGCTAATSQSNASNPNCRIGWDAPTGTGDNLWCYGVGSYTCTNPAIPAGTEARHTRILGQNYADCNPGSLTNPRDYVSNLTQLFAGYSLQYALDLRGAKYVDVQCIELTTHNGVCVTSGSPAYPRNCNRDQPLDDYALNGFRTDNTTANVTLQDVYVHGFNSSAFSGPIGGAITMTRVFAGFNAFAGWNFDDGSDTPDAAGSSINAHYVTMIGNGCYEEYPVKHGFSAQACYDDQSGGFGDAWSGQDTDLDSFLCDHCVMAYNTKDAFIGPHTNVKTLTITNSQSYGNMGAQWKWNNTPNATTTFANNLTVGNCMRMSAFIPGATQNFDKGAGVNGSYLSDYCRAGGNTVAINSQANSTVQFTNSTFVDYLDTVFLFSCGPNNSNRNQACGNTPFILKDNIFLSYHLSGGQAPGLIYIDDPSITVTQFNNLQFGNRVGHGEVCGTNGNLCADPLLINEPQQGDWADMTFLDNFNFKPSQLSPAIGAGSSFTGMLTTDIFGVLRSASPTIGAVEP